MTEQTDQRDVLIYGAGAVGCLLGGILAGGGCRVTLLGRPGARRPIAGHGLRVSLHDREIPVRPRYVTAISEIDTTPDLIVLAMRSFDVEAALDDLRQVVEDGTTVLTVQNGLGTEELVARELPGARIVAGSLTLSAAFEGAGRVVSSSRSGGIALAPVSSGGDAGDIAGLFDAGGIPVGVVDDYRSMKWSKLLLNMMANGVPAILGWPPGEVYRLPGLFRIERASVREALRVMRAEGSQPVALPGFPVHALAWLFRMPDAVSRRFLLPRIDGARGDKMPSLLLDLEAGRERTEAGWLYGAVAEAGERVGVGTPVNRRLVRILEAITANPDLWEAFRDRPDLLARNVLLGLEHPSKLPMR